MFINWRHWYPPAGFISASISFARITCSWTKSFPPIPQASGPTRKKLQDQLHVGPPYRAGSVSYGTGLLFSRLASFWSELDKVSNFLPDVIYINNTVNKCKKIIGMTEFWKSRYSCVSNALVCRGCFTIARACAQLKVRPINTWSYKQPSNWVNKSLTNDASTNHPSTSHSYDLTTRPQVALPVTMSSGSCPWHPIKSILAIQNSTVWRGQKQHLKQFYLTSFDVTFDSLR